jgi:hypothetical protein|tara:strand:+ start:36 stop:230 length:195 start_codon:yes stop_codon:yes gene_type:complete
MADIDYKKKPHKKTDKNFKLHKQFKTMSSNGTGGKTDFVFKNAMVNALATGVRTNNRKVKAMGE